jgi:aconitate hydratase 2/2-methylisocitrate dehydratase
VKLDKEPVIEYVNSNIKLLKAMIEDGYEDKRTIQRRVDKFKE